MEKRQRAAHIFPKARDGWYVEPAWCSQRLFEEECFPGVVWDPACGWGTITTAAGDAGYVVCGSDLINRRRHQLSSRFIKSDFLKWGKPFRAKEFSVVTNPPFDHVEAFARKALALGASRVALIMLVRRLNAAHWLRELPLQKILLLTPRPSMPPGEWIAAGNEPGGGTQDFAWIIMSRDYKGEPMMGWLARDGDENEKT